MPGISLQSLYSSWFRSIVCFNESPMQATRDLMSTNMKVCWESCKLHCPRSLVSFLSNFGMALFSLGSMLHSCFTSSMVATQTGVRLLDRVPCHHKLALVLRRGIKLFMNRQDCRLITYHRDGPQRRRVSKAKTTEDPCRIRQGTRPGKSGGRTASLFWFFFVEGTSDVTVLSLAALKCAASLHCIGRLAWAFSLM